MDIGYRRLFIALPDALSLSLSNARARALGTALNRS